MTSPRYVLVTAAYNEAALIEATIQSVVAQEVLPAKWIIVSDGSNDGTDEIVERYAAQHRFIQLHRVTEDHPRNFSAQVNAINLGISQMSNTAYSFFGNMDADVTFEPWYFKRLIDKFEQNPRLGLGGGAICERAGDGKFKPRITNSSISVAHAAQFFRRDCFDAVGGSYIPLPYGGPDTFAEIVARMKGWAVQSFSDLPVYHHRPTGAAGGIMRSRFRQGKMDYSLGALPLFELAKVAKRVQEKPYFIGSLYRLAGFTHSYLSREERAVPQEFMTYLRQEQKRRLGKMFRLRAA